MAEVTLQPSGSVGSLDDRASFATGEMFSADVSIDGGGTHTTDSDILDVRTFSEVAYQAVATCSASFSGDITFTLLASLDGTHWGSSAFCTVVLTGEAGATAISDASDSDDLSSVGYMKVSQIVNGDASHAIADCNLIVGVYQ